MIRQTVYPQDTTDYPHVGHLLVGPFPEPSTALLVGGGLLVLGFARKGRPLAG